jgi:hypothetical protein
MGEIEKFCCQISIGSECRQAPLGALLLAVVSGLCGTFGLQLQLQLGKQGNPRYSGLLLHSAMSVFTISFAPLDLQGCE